MSITFGGLATGLDTNAIVDQLMALERHPITRLESDKSWLQSRQAAYATLDAKMTGFLASIDKLGSSDELRQKSVSSSNEDFFSVTSSVEALPGASYQVEVVSLAQVQKNVSQGYADKTASIDGLGDLILSIGDNDPVTISIDESNNSLEGLMQAINDADAGVNASIINDGTDTPYRLVLTGENVATTFSLESVPADTPLYNGDLTAALQVGGYSAPAAQYFGAGTIETDRGNVDISGANSLNDIVAAINTIHNNVEAEVVDDGNGGFRINMIRGTLSAVNLSGGSGEPVVDILALTETQAASQAHIRVDNIDIYSDSNTLSEAIPGLTLDLNTAEEGTLTSVSVSLDEDAIKSQVQSFVKGYNNVMSFISSQSTKNGSAGGVLGGDSGINTVKRRLQSMLTTIVDNTGNFAALSQLGLETQNDGTILLDDAILTDAIQNNLDSVEKLLVGEDEKDGVAVKFQNYLEGMTDSRDGLFAANKKSTESNVKRIDSRIEQIEMRLEKKEETMRAKFSALEELVSSMNNQSSFLAQQLDMLSNMMNRDK